MEDNKSKGRLALLLMKGAGPIKEEEKSVAEQGQENLENIVADYMMMIDEYSIDQLIDTRTIIEELMAEIDNKIEEVRTDSETEES